MEIPTNVLGRVLADLQIRQVKGKKNHKLAPSNQLSETEENLLKKVRDRLTELRDASNWNQIFDRLIDYRCQTDHSLLEGNIDFFLVCLFVNSDKPSPGCDKFFRHLNICYQCFEEFTEVMRSYTNRLAEWDRSGS
jgi:hypothetical protein